MYFQNHLILSSIKNIAYFRPYCIKIKLRLYGPFVNTVTAERSVLLDSLWWLMIYMLYHCGCSSAEREWAAIICTAMMGSHKSKLCLLSLPGLMTALFVAGGGSLDKYMQTFCLQVLFEWQPAWQSRSIMNMWEKLWAKYSSLDFGRLKVGFAKSVCKPSSLQFWALAKLQLSLMED